MKIYKGISGAEGISIGTIYYFSKIKNNEGNLTVGEAIVKAKEKLRKLYTIAKDKLGNDNAKIFEAYDMLLNDQAYISPIIDAEKIGVAPCEAIINQSNKLISLFENHKSEYMRQRSDDIKYVGDLLIDCINGNDDIFDIPENDKIILVAEELTPADTLQMDKTNIVGFATLRGGSTSHTVILAKSLGIPAIVGIKDLNKNLNGKNAIMDAEKGELIINPEEKIINHYKNKLMEEKRKRDIINSFNNTVAKTSDGVRIYVLGNIGNIEDVKNNTLDNIDGVGLFRSEFLFSSTNIKPTIEEQIISYSTVIDVLHPKSVTIRTMDIGGDKKIDYLDMPEEDNPFLGNRGIRMCLLNKEIFKEQLKAIIISASGKSVKILLPMITTVEEIEIAKKIIKEVQSELTVPYSKKVSVGMMIETPSSAINISSFVKYCDFFSIGTNDLIQYITASDRGNEFVSNLYSPYNPAVIKVIFNVIKVASENDKEISMCGDLAATTDMTALLLGLGLKKFSVPIPMVNMLKYTISKINLKEAEKMAKKILNTEREGEIKAIIEKFNAELNI